MIVAVSMFHNEADIAEATVRHLYGEGIDSILVADNLSTDGTRQILEDLARSFPSLEVLDDDDPAHYQGRKMTALAHEAGDRGATWVVPFDADEVWYSPGGTIGEVLAGCDADVLVAQGWDHLAHHGDPAGHPFRSMGHRRTVPQVFPKVAFRYHPDARLAEGNHAVSHPGGDIRAGLALRHFQYRTFDQYVAKVRHGKAALDLTTLPFTQGTHWRTAGARSDAELHAEWDRLCSEEGLVYDPAPLRCVR